MKDTTQELKSTKTHYFQLDVLKFFAVFLVLNSHLGDAYPESIHFLAKFDGQLANGLFFFCTGFIFLNKETNLSFDSWYKKRIQRIYATVFAWCLILSLVCQKDISITGMIHHGGGWFVSCIMIYYIIIFFILKTSKEKLTYWLLFTIASTIAYYIFFEVNKTNITIFNTKDGFTSYILYFSCVIVGGITAKKKKSYSKLPFCLCFFFVFYILLNLSRIYFKDQFVLQTCCIIPYLLSVFFFYQTINHPKVLTLFQKNKTKLFVRFISNLSLEIYIVQYACFLFKKDVAFPLNIILNLSLVICIAFITRSGSRLFLSIFDNKPINWQYIFALRSKN
jgi:peptidoglycan/LPS O-acetylase OafA/YrhL